jgi:2-polyprenyl-3-methyl-5-hydroxy-6-metoxy-1,4-benzoquinol methylase
MSNSDSNLLRYCPFCGASTAPYIIDSRDYNRGVSDARYHYHRCAKCRSVSLINAPEDLDRYYIHGYHEVPADVARIERRVEHERYKIELVKRFMDKGHLLEIGPSWGAFCLLAKRSGFAVEAIERNAECCEFLRKKIQVKALHSEREAEALDLVSTPNVIALWHVIEHMRDPRALLKRAAERLAPGGIAVIATPNPDAWQFRVFGRYWAHLDPPRHICLIPPDALCDQMQSFGLAPVMLTSVDRGSIECDVFGWRQSLSNLFTTPSVRKQVLYWGRLVADIARLVERREGRGSAYTAVFRKSPAAGDA